ncbi:MAG TPA: TraR/DksA C4-type zinc finger protein [Natronosporangium sp.]
METFVRETDGWVEQLRQRLTEDYEEHTRRLQELTADTSDPGELHNRSALAAATRQSLAEIHDALRRIRENRYGICTRCEAEIPRERLEVLPHARLCVPCQQRQGG